MGTLTASEAPMERASRFFVRQIHNSWANFIELVHASTPDGGVWGSPVHVAVPEPIGPERPVAQPAKDDYTWSVGDDADIVTVGATVYWPGKGDCRIGKEFQAIRNARSKSEAVSSSPSPASSRRLLRVMQTAQSQREYQLRLKLALLPLRTSRPQDCAFPTTELP